MSRTALPPPYLTDAEIDEICDGVTQPAAQARYLRSLGLVVRHKPAGRPLVGRAHFEQVMCQAPGTPVRTGKVVQIGSTAPDRSGLQSWHARARETST